jgi:hypothetical protein
MLRVYFGFRRHGGHGRACWRLNTVANAPYATSTATNVQLLAGFAPQSITGASPQACRTLTSPYGINDPNACRIMRPSFIHPTAARNTPEAVSALTGLRASIISPGVKARWPRVHALSCIGTSIPHFSVETPARQKNEARMTRPFDLSQCHGGPDMAYLAITDRGLYRRLGVLCSRRIQSEHSYG